MFAWLTFLLTLLTSPLALLIGRPIRGPVPVSAWLSRYTHGRVSPAALIRAFPWSALTPVVQWKLYPWGVWASRKAGFVAFTVFGHIFTIDDDPGPLTSFHEGVHVVQQSAFPLLGPLGYAIGYALDFMLWWSWRRFVPWRRTRAPLAEQIAYWADGRDPNL